MIYKIDKKLLIESFNWSDLDIVSEDKPKTINPKLPDQHNHDEKIVRKEYDISHKNISNSDRAKSFIQGFNASLNK